MTAAKETDKKYGISEKASGVLKEAGRIATEAAELVEEFVIDPMKAKINEKAKQADEILGVSKGVSAGVDMVKQTDAKLGVSKKVQETISEVDEKLGVSEKIRSP